MKQPFSEATLLIILLIFPALPFSDASFPVFGVPVYLTEWIILTASVTYLIAAFRKESVPVAVPRSVSAGVILVFSGFFLSSMVSGPGISREELGVLKSWIIFPAAGAFLLSRSVVQERGLRMVFLSWFLAVTAVASATLFPGPWAMETYDGRLVSFFRSPNHLAFFLVPGILSGTYPALAASDRIRRLSVLVLGVIPISALFRTGSLSGVLGFLSGMVIFVSAYRFGCRGVVRVAQGVVLFLSVSIIVFGFSGTWDRFSTGEIRNSSASRVMIWTAASDMLSDSPLFGIGPRNFQSEYLSRQDEYPPYLEWAVPHPHNVLLTFWLSGGLAGLFGLLILFGSVFLGAGKGIGMKNTTDRRPAIIIMSMASALLLEGLFDDPYSGVGPATSFFVLIALSILLSSQKRKDREHSRSGGVDSFERNPV